MKTKLSDVADRWTILRMKLRFDPGLEDETDNHQIEVMEALSASASHTDRIYRFAPLLESLLALAEANGRIWENEAAIRKEISADPAARGELSLAEIGARAVKIREYNKIRVDAKNRIDEFFGEAQDRKFEHASSS